MGHYILLGITFAFAAAVQPGPFQTYLISQALTKGWRRSLPAALAPLLSDGPIILLVLLVLVNVPPWLVSVLQLAGGVFLLYLAFGAWRTWREYDVEKILQAGSGRQTLLKAALVNLLNPNPYLSWSLVMGPLLLEAWRKTPLDGAGLLLGFYLTMILCSAGIILLFAASRGLGPRISRLMLGVSAVALACFGIYELWSGVQAFRL